MTIKITLEFATADLAIVALAKLEAPLNKKAATALPKAASEGAPAATPSGRKGRADKGKPRGSYSEKWAGKNGTDAAPDAGATSASVSAPAAQATASVPTESEAPAAPAQAEDTTMPDENPKHANTTMTSNRPVDADPPASAEQAQKTMEVLFAAKGLEVCLDTLKAFGVKRVGELKADDRAAFIARTKEALA